MAKLRKSFSWSIFLVLIFISLLWLPQTTAQESRNEIEIQQSKKSDNLAVSNEDIIQQMEHKSLQQTSSKSQVGPWARAFLATTVISVIPIFLVFVIPCLSDEASPSRKQALKTLVSFAVGGLLGDVFLHLLPHSVPNAHGHNHGHEENETETSNHNSQFLVGVYVLIGMLVFFIIEKYTRITASGHSHGFLSESSINLSSSTPSLLEGGKHKKEEDHSHGEKCVDSKSGETIKIGGLLNIIADVAHNFTDGMAIAASFLISEQVGLSTTIAVLFHEVPHEIGDYAILIQSGMTTRRAMMVQFFTAIGAYLGTFFGLVAGGSSSFHWVLPFTAGGFIYLATVNVIPELLETTTTRQSIKEILAIICGGCMMAFLSFFE